VLACAIGLLLLAGCSPAGSDQWAVADSPGGAIAGDATGAVDATVSPGGAAVPEQPATSAPAPAKAAPGTLVVSGMCSKPGAFTLASLKAMGVSKASVAYPGKGTVQVSGVKFMTILTVVDVSESSMYALFKTVDGSEVQVPLSDTVASPDAMLEIDSAGRINTVFPNTDKANWIKNIASVEFR
jgi:hypothetical protein